jgi:medium-chain acyl-[acyl-carrier-protein] hydrolase
MNAREEKFVVQAYQCHSGGHMKISSLMQCMQEIATIHAEQLGFGYDALDKAGIYWVLSNIIIEFSEIPGWNDEISLKTWPSGCSRLIATREFICTGTNNRTLFRATSQWMVLSRNSSRPKDLIRLIPGLPKNGEKALDVKLNRLEPQNSYIHSGSMYVPYSSIDLNGHVNFTEYIRWGVDALKRTFRLDDSIRSLQATYLSEVFENDELELLVSDNNDKQGVQIRRPNKNNAVFLMEISR